jgi:hypothetical protein
MHRQTVNNALVAHSIRLINARKKNAVNKVTPAAGGKVIVLPQQIPRRIVLPSADQLHQRIIIITLS